MRQLGAESEGIELTHAHANLSLRKLISPPDIWQKALFFWRTRIGCLPHSLNVLKSEHWLFPFRIIFGGITMGSSYLGGELACQRVHPKSSWSKQHTRELAMQATM